MGQPAPPGSHYAVLGVGAGASQGEIRAAYLALARRHHPDVDPAGGRAAGARMARINEAWAVLGDPARRADYDRAVSVDSGMAGRAGSSATVRPPRGGFRPLHPDDEIGWEEPDGDAGPAVLSRPVVFAPLALAGLSVVALWSGAYLDAGVLTAAGGVAGVLAVLSFVLVPFVALVRASRSDGRP